MYVLKDNGVIGEIECGNNFGYILGENKFFVSTDYKVLQSQSNGIFVPCMKMMYNGKIELYYITDDFRPMSTMFSGITTDVLINIIVNMFGSVVEVKNNGFLQSQNIDISWDKIFVDASTLKVKLVYLPINIKAFDSYSEFESELRASLVKLINRLFTVSNDRLDKFVNDLINGSLSIEDIYNKYKGTGVPSLDIPTDKKVIKHKNQKLKLVAMNSPYHFEAVLDKEQNVIGKKKELVDIVIDFNNMISRKHCSIIKNNGSYYLVDEGSANGTYVNSIKVTSGLRVPIYDGDIIKIADSSFQLVKEGEKNV